MAKRRRRRAKPRKPMPRKPPKVEVPKTVYRRRRKHPKSGAANWNESERARR